MESRSTHPADVANYLNGPLVIACPQCGEEIRINLGDVQDQFDVLALCPGCDWEGVYEVGALTERLHALSEIDADIEEFGIDAVRD
jgi:RNase P subunit RPR2